MDISILVEEEVGGRGHADEPVLLGVVGADSDSVDSGLDCVPAIFLGWLQGDYALGLRCQREERQQCGQHLGLHLDNCITYFIGLGLAIGIQLVGNGLVAKCQDLGCEDGSVLGASDSDSCHRNAGGHLDH